MPISRHTITSALPLLLVTLTFTSSAWAAPGLWADVNDADLAAMPATKSLAKDTVHPREYRALLLDEAGMRDALDGAAKAGGARLSLPLPDGTEVAFNVVEASIMDPALAAKFPDIRTYAGIGADGRYARLDFTPQGFHALILGEHAVYIDPFTRESSYVSYFAEDDSAPADRFACMTKADESGRPKLANTLISNAGTLRTFRLAIACTGEYAQFQGGTVNLTLAAITTTINRVTGIYETELGVSFTLVASEASIVFTDATTDPFFGNNDAGTLIDESQTVIDNVIGSANYDVGHTFSTGGGGLAYLGVVCDSTDKARGITGSSSPVGDAYDVDYVAHEMGHQFGANHTFNSVTSSCQGNRVGSTAYERGSGSSIMAYAGICGKDDLQPHSDPYFHSASLQEIFALLPTYTCAVTASTGDTAPTINAGADYTIPKSTPFTLTAVGSDVDLDTVSYLWEERDLGPAQKLKDADNGSSPLFRVYGASTSPARNFPLLLDILNGSKKREDVLPSLSRTMTFWCVARDNNGGVSTDDALVTVDANSGPFRITAPNTAVSFRSGKKNLVTWNVAGTAGAPINVSEVRILLSTDGGHTYPTVLAAHAPNTGSRNIKFPVVTSTQARIKIQAVGNIFWDISDTNFTIH